MTRAYSNDLRERVVFTVETGEATRSGSQTFWYCGFHSS